MDENCDMRQWDEMIPDALGLIFKYISLQEALTVIPSVCKGWRRAIMGPYCWQEIDILEWSQHCIPENREKMLQMLINRSSGALRKICVSHLQNDHNLSFIADHAKFLTTLQLPRSSISNSMMERVAECFSNITTLDVSYCRNIGWSALESIGKHCRNLKVLRRNMTPMTPPVFIKWVPKDDEALAVASTMPNLVHLELTHLLITTDAVISILKNCKDLKVLDLRGCWSVRLDADLTKRFEKVRVVGPYDDGFDSSVGRGWEMGMSSSRYFALDFVAGEIDEFDEFWEEDDEEEMDDFYDDGYEYDGDDGSYGYEYDGDDDLGFEDWPHIP